MALTVSVTEFSYLIYITNIKGLGLLVSQTVFPIQVYVKQVTPEVGPYLTPGL